MKRRQQRRPDRRLIIVALFLILGLGLGLGFGLGFGLNHSTTTTTTTTTATTSAPTTAPTLAPCDQNYTLVTQSPISTSFYLGQWADYYNNSFTYFNTSDNPNNNFTLIRIDKSTGNPLWSHTLCKIYQNLGQYVAVDRVSGDTFFLYQCDSGTTALSRYDTNGNIIWNVSLVGTIDQLQSPIEIDLANQQIYFTVSDSISYAICALSINDGSTVWCTSNSEELSGVVYMNGAVYVISYCCNNTFYKFNATTGSLIALVSTLPIRYSNGIAADTTNGYVYIYGLLRNNYQVGSVIKYDESLNVIWNIIFPPTTQIMQNSFNGKSMVYDPISNLLVIVTDVEDTETFNLFRTGTIHIHTLDADNGNFVNFFKTVVVPNIRYTYPNLVLNPEAGEAFYSARVRNFTSSQRSYELGTYCYGSQTPICHTCNSSFVTQASPVSSQTNIDYDIYQQRLFIPKIVSPGAVLTAGTDWTITLCGSGFDGVIYVTVDQTTGGAIVVWKCLPSDNAVYLAAFDINGIQIWSRTYSDSITPSDAVQIDYVHVQVYFLYANASTSIIVEGLSRVTGTSVFNTTVSTGDLTGSNRMAFEYTWGFLFIASGFANGIKINLITTSGTSSVIQTITNTNIRYVTGITTGFDPLAAEIYIAGNGVGSTNLFLAKFTGLAITLQWLVYRNATSNTFTYDNAIRPAYYFPLTRLIYTVASVSNGTLLLSSHNSLDGSVVTESTIPTLTTTTSGATFAVNPNCNGGGFVQFVGNAAVTNITGICFN